MNKTNIDGIEIDQKMMESLNVGDRFDFSKCDYSSLGIYEEREKIVNRLYKEFKHIIVSSDDQVFGLKEDKYVLIKEAKGLYQAINSVKI